MDIGESLNNEMLSMWESITREGFGVTDVIKEEKRLCVYESFMYDQKYREGLCYFVGGKYNEDMLNRVPNAGGGSSFDRFAFQDRGTEMATNSRHQQIMDTVLKEWYIWSLAKNTRIMNTYKDLFNPDGERLALWKSIMGSDQAKSKGNLKGTARPTKAMKVLTGLSK
jgi:hypothetical protein